MSLKFTKEMVSGASEDIRIRFLRDTAKELHETYGDYFPALNVTPDDLMPICEATDRYAESRGLVTRRDIYRLIVVALSLGHRFWEDPRFHSYIARSVDDTAMDKSRRALAMVDFMKEWLRLLWQDDTLEGFAGRLVEAVRGGQGPDALHGVLPQHWKLFSDADNTRLVAGLLRPIPDTLFPTPSHRLAYLSLALVYGVKWHDNPHFAVFSDALERERKPEALAGAIDDIFTAMFAADA